VIQSSPETFQQSAEKRWSCHCEERSDVAIQIKMPLLSVELAKKRKKVWIASRHASLAVAMTGAGTAFFNSR